MGLPLPLLNLRRRLAGGISPAALFLNSEPGVWYDPSDLTTMFQDRAGATLVTTPGQSVGLVLDKRLGLTPGPELVTNGTFDTDTAWTYGASSGWSIGAGVATFAGGTGDIGLYQSVSPIAGRFYRVTISQSGRTAGNLVLRLGGTTNLATVGTANGEYSFLVAAEGANSNFAVIPTATYRGSVDNISVRELPGNHMVATADASRGTYGIEPFGGRRNLLTFTEQFENAAWSKTDITVTANAAVAPDGTMTADRIAATVDNGRIQQGTSQTVQTYTHSLWVRSESGTVSGSIYGISSFATRTQFTATTTWQRVSNTVTSLGGTRILTIELNTAGTSILIWGAQLEVGSTATNYQRVTTAFDVTEAGVPTVHYVQFDGADDGYLTSTITPGTDKVQVFAGVRKLSDVARGILAESSATRATNNGAITMDAPGDQTLGSRKYVWASKGTLDVFVETTSTTYNAPITNVLTGLGDISGDLATLRINGTQVAQSATDQGTGNYLAYPLYIGRRGGTSLPFNGRLYQMVVRFGPNLDAARIEQVERFINSKTGAY